MKRIFVLMLLFMSAVAVRAVQTARVDDPAGILRERTARQLDGLLTDLEKETGVRAVMRFHEHLPAPEEDDAPGVYMRGLSTKLGLIDEGVLAVYFADEKEWRVWIGNDLAARFAGHEGTAGELTASGAMHDAKEAWMEQVFAAAEKGWTEWNKVARAQPEPGEKVRFEAMALTVGLRTKFARRE